MKLSIIIPVFNEKNTIREVISRVKAITISKEIIIVDDFSNDGTRKILEQIGNFDTICLYHKQNSGKGAAIRTGLKKVSGDIVIIQDADLEYNPNQYHKLIQPILHGQASVVYGSRFLAQQIKFIGKNKTIYPAHYFGNKFLSLLTTMLYWHKVSDMETGYKVFKSEVIKNIDLRSERFDFEPEITAKVLKKGHKILEIPIEYQPRRFDEGKKITWLDGVKAAYYLCKYRLVD